VLTEPDGLILTEVYAAGEAPIAQADGRALVRAIRQLGRIEPIFAAELQELPGLLDDLVQPGDVVLCMGAGSIGGLAPQLAERRSTAASEVIL